MGPIRIQRGQIVSDYLRQQNRKVKGKGEVQVRSGLLPLNTTCSSRHPKQPHLTSQTGKENEE